MMLKRYYSRGVLFIFKYTDLLPVSAQSHHHLYMYAQCAKPVVLDRAQFRISFYFSPFRPNTKQLTFQITFLSMKYR